MTVLVSPATFVLERRIDHPLADVEAVLRSRALDGLSFDLGDGALVIAGVFVPKADPWYPSSRARAQLVTSRGRKVARVELVVAPWSTDATRLEVRPMARHPQRWAPRRLRRYFELAHQSADALLRLANAGCEAIERRPAMSTR